MIHEVMVLDHSGPALGLILHGSAMKLFLLGALVLNVIFPMGSSNLWVGWFYFILEMLLLAVTIGWVESIMARLKLRHIPNLLVSASLLAAFSLILLLR